MAAPELEWDTVERESLLLDPNNPRYQASTIEIVQVPQARWADEEVQNQAYNRLVKKFDVKSLAESIAEIGFLPIDSIVVAPAWEGAPDKAMSKLKGKYLVVEGNRRVAALRMIHEGHIRAPDNVIINTKELRVAVVRGERARLDVNQAIMQGTRHVSGPMKWRPVQQARAIKLLMENEGMTPEEIQRAFQMKAHTVKQLLRALECYTQYQDDPRYSSIARPDDWSFFEIMAGSPPLRAFAGWSETKQEPTNRKKWNKFLRIIRGDPEKGFKPAIGGPNDLRYIRQMVDRKDREALALLAEEPPRFREAVAVLLRNLDRDEIHATARQLSAMLTAKGGRPISKATKEALLSLRDQIDAVR